MLMPFISRPSATKDPWLGEDTYRQRARAIKDSKGFRDRVSEALKRKRDEADASPYVEAQIYDGFASDCDERLKAEFHKLPWAARPEVCARFSDERLKELGIRLLYIEHPEVLSYRDRERMNQWLAERLSAEGSVPWTTISKAMIELEEVRRNATSAETRQQIREIDGYLHGLAGTRAAA
jgi:exodeoxyribonuclease-1